MPKEVLHDDRLLDPGMAEVLGVSAGNSTPYAVEVTWGRDGAVQLSTVHLQREQYTPERGYFVDLDRGMVNRLIRVLRRARDQAYGTDE